MKVNFPYQ